MSVYVILHLVSESRNFQDVRETVGLKKKITRENIRETISEKF